MPADRIPLAQAAHRHAPARSAANDVSLAPDAQTDENRFDPGAAAQMERMVADFARMYRERNEALEEVARAHHQTLMHLAMAADFKDDDTGVHIVRIGFLSEALALLLGETPERAAMLRKAAPMHDIGKIGIPDSVLKKPGPLDPAERLIMNRHPQIGADILGRSRIALFQLAAEIALTHHERYDGTGYPRQLRGADIPLNARIVSVVDFFDALTMDRVYRKAFSEEVALEMLRDQRGVAFDPRVVDAFLDNAPAIIALRDEVNRTAPTFESLAAASGPRISLA